MTEDRTSSAVDRLTYLLIGAGIGAAVALLFAPKPGRELRTDIADASRKSLDYANENARRLGERASDLYQNTTQKASDIYSNTAQRAQELIEAGKETVTSKRGQLAAAIEAGKEAYAEEKGRGAAAPRGVGGGPQAAALESGDAEDVEGAAPGTA